MRTRTKHLLAAVSSGSALCVCVGPVLAAVTVGLHDVTTTTSTPATGQVTGA